MPLVPRLFESLERTTDTTSRSSPHSKFHHENRKTKNQKKEEVNQHEGRTAILSRDKRETPHVAKPDGTTGRNQDKT